MHLNNKEYIDCKYFINEITSNTYSNGEIESKCISFLARHIKKKLELCKHLDMILLNNILNKLDTIGQKGVKNSITCRATIYKIIFN